MTTAFLGIPCFVFSTCYPVPCFVTHAYSQAVFVSEIDTTRASGSAWLPFREISDAPVALLGTITRSGQAKDNNKHCAHSASSSKVTKTKEHHGNHF